MEVSQNKRKRSPNSGENGAKNPQTNKKKNKKIIKAPGISEARWSRYLFANEYAEKGRISSKHVKACQAIIAIPLINHFLHEV